ncbi:hypothetical protein KB879_06075 [Cupriavidus sp. KK10]|uniref:hypothetical protein n=1 Tax=Cupriavidus sp. KK10 TaxID=1478019 RepID=UPI001BAB3687|nr:hypothetical protein [Cupriavidus sp. KK10]QUN29513.1 hypothetical protein KB879_06075 [Cupriavidus sp. KK10]
MSEINVNRSEVDEERYFAHLDQKQLEELVAKAVAESAGLDLTHRNVSIKRLWLSSTSTSTGYKYEAQCEIVVDRRQHPAPGEQS